MYLEFREIPPGDKFISLCDGEQVYRGKMPIYAGSRALIKLGHDPNTHVTWHTSSGTPSMRGTLKHFAYWSVSERERGGLRRIKYEPRDLSFLKTAE